MTRAKPENAQKLTADSRRFTQMDTERNPFKNITAEAQRSQRIAFFVCRETTTNKNMTLLKLGILPNRRLPIGQKFLPSAYSASLR